MTPEQAICGRTRPGEAWFDEDETATIIKRLNEAGYVIVPIKPTDDMLEELARIGDGPLISGAEVWGYMLAAATAQASIKRSHGSE